MHILVDNSVDNWVNVWITRGAGADRSMARVDDHLTRIQFSVDNSVDERGKAVDGKMRHPQFVWTLLGTACAWCGWLTG